MKVNHSNEEVVWRTKWFQIVARQTPSSSEPHYSLQTRDYVGIVALNRDGKLLLVRQYRPAVEATTLELPSGHVEDGQTPEAAARQELLEETGHVADRFEYLGNLSPDTGRLSNRLWGYFAANATPTRDPNHRAEAGIDFVLYGETVRSLLAEKDFCSALNRAVVLAAVLKGHISI